MQAGRIRRIVGRVKEQCKKKFGQDIAIILAGDFNAHNVSWNCKNSDYSGRILLEETEEEGLYIVNDDTMSRMGNVSQQDSYLDVVFVSESIVDKVRYEQLEDTWGSDHFPIICDFEVQSQLMIKL